MSWLAIDWAEEVPVASVYERVILLALATRANSDGTDAFPSKTKMARSAMCDPKTIQRHLDALRRRGVIAPGDQSVAAYIRADRRPVVYDLLIPYEWYSKTQLAKLDLEREEKGLGPLRPEDRPPLEAPPEKVERSDKGKPRTRKPRKAATSDDATGGQTVLPSMPVDNSAADAARGDSQSGTGGLSVRHGGTLSPARGDSETPESLREEPVPEPVLEPPGGPAPLDPPVPAADASGTEHPGQSKYVVPQGDLVRNHLHASARKLAGPAAVAAVRSDPDIGEDELSELIVQTTPGGLTHAQAFGRAATLLAWERKPRVPARAARSA